MLKQDYNNGAAHEILVETFSELGSRNDIVK